MVRIETQLLDNIVFTGSVRTSGQEELSGDSQEHNLKPPEVSRFLGLMVDAEEDSPSQPVPQFRRRRSVWEVTSPVLHIGEPVDEGEALH